MAHNRTNEDRRHIAREAPDTDTESEHLQAICTPQYSRLARGGSLGQFHSNPESGFVDLLE